MSKVEKSGRPPLSGTPRTQLGRLPERGVFDRDELDAILDATMICHLGLVVNDAPLVIPTVYGRDGNTLYVHGSTGARSLMTAASGVPACVTVTHLDGIVYARSAFSHSVNYRSAVIHGSVVKLEDEEARLHALKIITQHAVPGAWEHVRHPSKKELAATMVLALDLTEASVKVRTGGPSDDPQDVENGGVWAGVLPVITGFGIPKPSGDLEQMDIPEYVLNRGPQVRTHSQN